MTIFKGKVFKVPKTNELLEILKKSHIPESGLHLGLHRTIERIKELGYYFKGMTFITEEFIKKCIICSLQGGPCKKMFQIKIDPFF